MTDEEKLAIEIVNNLDTEIYDCEGSCVSIYDYMESACLAGIKAGKPKWHDLRKSPNDLPKESDRYLCYWEGGEQWIMDFEAEVNSFGYWCNVYDKQSLGFVDSVFETIKERGEDEVIAWCELPKFKE